MPVRYQGGILNGQPIPGASRRGDVDVNHRPNITNEDGSKSSIYSMTVPISRNGAPVPWESKDIANYALVPSIVNGRFLSPNGKMPTTDQANRQLEDAATRYYGKTRQNLGTFQSPGYADEYASLTHDYGNNGTRQKIFMPSPSIRSIVENTQRNISAPVPSSIAEPIGMDMPGIPLAIPRRTR